MALDKNSDQKELECYTKIINLFSKMGDNPLIHEMYKDKAILKIMNDLKNPKNENWLKNSIIILLSLFDDNSADLYDNLGLDGKSLVSPDKDKMFSKLRKEYFLKQREKKFDKILRKIQDKEKD